MDKIKKLAFPILFILILIIFCYFRLKPIINQTVPYTYDQGRDFLQAEAIIRDKNLTFIGPTTGIPGVFHGAWWYYYLSIPYFLFNGALSSFYFFIFTSFLLVNLFFFYFLKKELNTISAAFFLASTVASPYFISVSIFVLNSFLVIPFLLLLFFSTYKFLQKEDFIYLFLVFLSLGFIFESEIALGLFIIPAYLVTILLTGSLKKYFGQIKKILLSFLGILVPLSLRILFELKHGFMQTKAFFYFFYHPTSTNATTFKGTLIDRSKLFIDYLIRLSPDSNIVLALLFVLLIVYLFIRGFKVLQPYQKTFVFFLSLFFLSLFFITLFYRNNFFWGYYVEGLPYFYLILSVFGIYTLSKERNKYAKISSWFFLAIFILFPFLLFTRELNKPHKNEGMIEQVMTVEKIYQTVGKNDFCARIYTPPVITYTYNYLFDHYSQTKGFKMPQTAYVKGQCWYIVEKDSYQFRVDNWRKENIPRVAKIISTNHVSDSISLELWEIK